MDDQELLRYSKHILLDHINIEGQIEILRSKILIIGCGGLGNILAMYLAANGVKEITLVDYDKVELSNLPRQIAFDTSDINQYKTDVLQQKLYRLNPNIHCITLNSKLNPNNIESITSDHPIIVDCTDQIATKKMINQTAKKLKKIHVFASAIQFTGYFALFDFNQEHQPCLSCLFPEKHYFSPHQQNSCLNNGVYTPIVGMVSMLALNEILKLLGKFGLSTPFFWRIESYQLTLQKFTMTKNPNCPVCQP